MVTHRTLPHRPRAGLVADRRGAPGGVGDICHTTSLRSLRRQSAKREELSTKRADYGQPLVTHAGRPVGLGEHPLQLLDLDAAVEGHVGSVSWIDVAVVCRSAQRPLRRRAAGISGRADSRRPRPGGQGRMRPVPESGAAEAGATPANRPKPRTRPAAVKVTELRGSDIGSSPSPPRRATCGGEGASPQPPLMAAGRHGHERV